ncbi:hypothetical protein FNB15_03675 [Ferrovibrio terrae]|uniref:Uncharacterized protein n=1 Tax=Ferrovibrio terrae TaxID=2594003 RepID=A0A516GY56_9PROT|nr:hypothetical protein [Ferrovibrio terrae]QDO96427.1 hypothetical protein FNB15_03675 [Ferrovibrio terrae]
MSALRPDGVGAPQPDLARPTRKSPVAIPWREIACRLAEGARPAAVAADLGLAEERIWRHLRKSLRFRFYLQQAMERQRLLAGLQLATLGQTALLSRGLNPENLDGDLLRLLHEAAHRQEPGSDLAPQIEQLGKTGEPPPNMAFRRRLAEERQRMDQQMEVWRAQDAARASGAAAEPQRTATNTHEPVRTATNPSEPSRSATNTSEPLRSATNPSEAERAPRPRPPSPPAEPPPRAVVDLDGPDLARLRAQGLLGSSERPPDS